jgi:bacillithiol synthase
VDVSCTYVPYNETGYFSRLATDYTEQNKALEPFYEFAPDAQGIDAAIKARAQFPVNREVLVATLQKQYARLPAYDAVNSNIEKLKEEHCFTICTAHQPNLMTGYLYFIYKIAHAIKLANELNEQYSDKHFVPVYYIGSEDNDLEELGTFRYGSKKFVWDAAGQTGAVGRMDTKSLEPLVKELFKLLGPPGEHLDTIKETIETAYLQHNNIADATQYLVHMLFGTYGLVVLNPDEAAFKQSIEHIIKDDLLNHTAHTIVTAEIEKLAHYKGQAHPRPVNLFYLDTQLRERIEENNGVWQVLNTEISLTKNELLALLEQHPERFSPNVILRGLFQESILPNVAFIGGGAEVAYWLQLKALFSHYHVFYPLILLRQSILWIPKKQAELRKKTDLSIPQVFMPLAELERAYIAKHGNNNWQLTTERGALEKLIQQLKEKATELDVTLASSAEAALAKINHQVQVLEKKMLRAEKRKAKVELERIGRLKEQLFPNHSLQERTENAVGYLAEYGNNWLDEVIAAIQPLQQQFAIIEEC